jgi:hypothetical protein
MTGLLAPSLHSYRPADAGVAAPPADGADRG